MNLQLDTDIPASYHSKTQRARIITEGWMQRYMFCPVCGNAHLTHFVANRPVADFYCDHCRQEFELKSKEGSHVGTLIADGAYKTMMQRISSNNNPNLFYMTHENDAVNNLILIPRYFFTPNLIEARKPLAETARRAGWVGCNINISTLPASCRIGIVNAGLVQDKATILEEYNRIKALQVDNLESRGWLMDLLYCVGQIPDKEFRLEQVYAFTPYLAQRHPGNNFIHAKIRQQLQFLRDRGYLTFLGRGVYRK